VSLIYGVPGDAPLVGDWDGDGIDTVGIYRNNEFYLRNNNTAGPADVSLIYGVPGDAPLVGDWDEK
jgi:lysyl endopeptidase